MLGTVIVPLAVLAPTGLQINPQALRCCTSQSRCDDIGVI